jgi:hypothetical protein
METAMNARFRCAALVLGLSLTLPVAASEGMRVYEPGELAPHRYQVVARLWVESWRSAFEMPGHADVAAAVAELKAEAARRGADALANVSCLADGGRIWGGPHVCYALAIKLK